jgi:prepilin-type N-terminal cleavage/methylation domain-containing protein
MRLPPQKCRAFTVVELMVCVIVLGVLVLLAIPNIHPVSAGVHVTETLANARSLQQATQMMTLDSQTAGKGGLQWTTRRSEGDATPISLATFLGALTKGGYMTDADLRKVLTASGIGPGRGPITAENIAFKIYEVSEDSPSDQVFLTTRNITPPNGGMEAGVNPYGTKAFVFFTKGGGGGIRTRRSDATDRSIFPVGKVGNGDGTVEYRYVPLK